MVNYAERMLADAKRRVAELEPAWETVLRRIAELDVRVRELEAQDLREFLYKRSTL